MSNDLLSTQGHMLLRRKQTPNDEEQLIPHAWSWQATEREEGGRSNNRTPRVAKFSRLSAQMVELSVQQAQRERTLRGTVPNNLSSVSSPLLCLRISWNRFRPFGTGRQRIPGVFPPTFVTAKPVVRPFVRQKWIRSELPNCLFSTSRSSILPEGVLCDLAE